MLPTVQIAALLAAFAGLFLGSFLNVCIVRLPAGASIVGPRSQCPACQRTIRAFDNIPILSWLLLRGHCRDCDAAISLQYPLVEAATALLLAACVLHTGLHWQTWLDATLAFFALGLAVMDVQTLLLPDAFTLGGLALALLLRAAHPAPNRLQSVIHAALAAALAALLLLCVRWLYHWLRKQEGMGLGDVKLLAMIAAFLGLPLALLAFFLAIISGALVAVAYLLRCKTSAQQKIPFGSYLSAAAMACIFVGKPILHWYLGFFR